MFDPDSDDPALVQLFAHHPTRYRILISLLVDPPKKVNQTELADRIGVSSQWVNENRDIIEYLVEIGALECISSNGHNEYRLNLDSDYVQAGVNWVKENEKWRRRVEDDVEEASESFFE